MAKTDHQVAAASAAKKRKAKRAAELARQGATTVAAEPPRSAAQLSANWRALSKTLVKRAPAGLPTGSTVRKRKAAKTTEQRVLERVLQSATTEKSSRAWIMDDPKEAASAVSAAVPSASSAAGNKSSKPTSTKAAKGGLKHQRVAQEQAESVAAAAAPSGIITKYIAIDCEMVGTGANGATSALARCSIVNQHGEIIYDTFVQPKERVTDFRTQYSGIRPANIANAPMLEEIQPQVAELLKDRILVGHHIEHDLKALMLSHPRRHIRDTSKYPPFRAMVKGKSRRPALRHLARILLGLVIQDGEHSSLEDAQATMALYSKYAKEWEKSLHKRPLHGNDVAPAQPHMPAMMML